MFLLLNISGNFSINIKCHPEKALMLREKYPAVLPGYHMNKKHWNTVMLDNSVNDDMLKEWISDSYLLVLNSLNSLDKKRIHQKYNM